MPAAKAAAPAQQAQNWRGALKELKINTENHHKIQDDGDLTPDSMSSRMIDSGVGMGFDEAREAKIDGIAFDKMGSRVGTFAT
jgi:glucosamine-6-phosphate deaminase